MGEMDKGSFGKGSFILLIPSQHQFRDPGLAEYTHPVRTLAYQVENSMRAWLKGPLFHLDPAKVPHAA